MFSEKKAIFWDNDGILVDTEKFYFEATRRVMAAEGFDLTKELFIELFLVQAVGAWHLLDQKRYSADQLKRLKQERDKLYKHLLLSKDIVIEGIEPLLQYLSAKYRMAIVTSSKPEHFNTIHQKTGLLKYFEFSITAENYSNYKPHPEPYLVAVSKMGISAAEGIAIEDSRRGLLSATAAGLDCIVVKSELTAASDFSSASLVIDHISDLSVLL